MTTRPIERTNTNLTAFLDLERHSTGKGGTEGRRGEREAEDVVAEDGRR